MIRSLLPLLLALASVTATLENALGQTSRPSKGEANEPLRMRLNPFRMHLLQVESNPKGTSLAVQDTGTGWTARGLMTFKGKWTDLAEGHYLGISPAPDFTKAFALGADPAAFQGSHLFRAEVKSIAENGTAIINVGAVSAKSLKLGDRIVLFRPLGVSTTQIKKGPDWLELPEISESETPAGGKPEEQAGQPQNQTGGSGKSPKPAGGLLDNIKSAQLAAQMTQSRNNLKQLGLSLHNFHDSSGHLPPAVLYGPDGKPWHSWRVMILPFIDQIGLYNEYKWTEPWNGPNNSKLLKRIPPLYSDPVHGMNKDFSTHYAAIVGNGTAFPPAGLRLVDKADGLQFDYAAAEKSGKPGAARLSEFKNGTTNVVLIGPVSPDRKIPWMKPEDITFDDKFPRIGDPNGFAAPYPFGDDFQGVFLMADGSVRAMGRTTPLDALRKLMLTGAPFVNTPAIAGAPAATGTPEPAVATTEKPTAPAILPNDREPVLPVFVLTPAKGNSYTVRIEVETVEVTNEPEM